MLITTLAKLELLAAILLPLFPLAGLWLWFSPVGFWQILVSFILFIFLYIVFFAIIMFVWVFWSDIRGS